MVEMDLHLPDPLPTRVGQAIDHTCIVLVPGIEEGVLRTAPIRVSEVRNRFGILRDPTANDAQRLGRGDAPAKRLIVVGHAEDQVARPANVARSTAYRP